MDRFPNIVILLDLPQDYILKAEFVLRTFCNVLRLHPQFVYGERIEGVHLYYGPDLEREFPLKIHYDAATADFFNRLELYPLDKVNFCLYQKDNIPFLFSRPGAIFSIGQRTMSFRKDIVASAFYFLTCWHEYILSQRGEQRGRVDFRESLQYRWDFIDIPVVDVYCQMLLYAMERALPQFIREIVWDEDSRFSVSLSHDVDYWNFWAGTQQVDTLKYNLRTWFKRPVTATFKILGHTLHKNLIHNPRRQIRWIVHKERDLGVKATWFLFGKDDFEDKRQNYISNPKVLRRLKELLSGEEVGLHGSPESAFDEDVLRAELDKLHQAGFEVRGYRSHYLNFDYQKSFRILENAGIQYDSTLGYWENIGFRAGISFPFHPFNIRENRPFRVLEIPLIVMDTTLHSKKAMNTNPLSARVTLRRLIDMADTYQSHLSLLWHNITFDPIDFPLWGGVYWSTLRHAIRSGGWVTSLHDIWTEWTNLD
ncbi:MAG: polysaccharide deacetylase family protein [Candidatus Cloacimonetes bacterium]|nr:polysaccharide deacetylase family protein [Candidatus Cloacimonadota bacterium]